MPIFQAVADPARLHLSPQPCFPPIFWRLINKIPPALTSLQASSAALTPALISLVSLALFTGSFVLFLSLIGEEMPAKYLGYLQQSVKCLSGQSPRCFRALWDAVPHLKTQSWLRSHLQRWPWELSYIEAACCFYFRVFLGCPWCYFWWHWSLLRAELLMQSCLWWGWEWGCADRGTFREFASKPFPHLAAAQSKNTPNHHSPEGQSCSIPRGWEERE